MRIKYNILILVNDHTLRHGLFREFEDESNLYYAAQFSDILAEIKWQELDAVVIDTNDVEIDTIGVMQLINTTCPSVGVILLSEKNNMVLDQVKTLLPQTKLVLGKIPARKIAPHVRAAIRQSKRMRSSQIGGIGGAQYAEDFTRINEHLIISMMGVNEIAAAFQLDRNDLSASKIHRMDSFCQDLDELVSKYKVEKGFFIPETDDEVFEEFITTKN